MVVIGSTLLFSSVQVSPSHAGPIEKNPLPQFVDVTQTAGISFVHSIGDSELSNIVESSGAGCCFFDYDGDGDLDIYLMNGAYLDGVSDPAARTLRGKLTNALYRNNGDGTFTDVTRQAGAGGSAYGMGCLSADYDNDGNADLFLTNYGSQVLYHNNGDGTFTDVTREAGLQSSLWATGATFLDYDNDGHLDLYVGHYLEYDPHYKLYFAADRFPGPLSYKGQPDTLYHNRGNGTFEDVTRKAGVYNPEGRAMGVASCDYDDDGYMDIFVANDAMENYLYRNNRDGTFTNVAVAAGVAFGKKGEATSAMGGDFGDINLDGLVDLLVPAIAYSALYQSLGNGTFEDRSVPLGLAAASGQYTSWSGLLFDYDSDGYLDIFLSNGKAHHLEPEEALLLRNEKGSRFIDVSQQSGKDFQEKFVGRGAAAGDYDNDGDLDLLVLDLNARPRLLRNDGHGRVEGSAASDAAHWLMIHAVGTMSNRDAIGTMLRVKSGELTQTRYVLGNSGYLSQGDRRAHFGLGARSEAQEVEIRWPGGRKQILRHVPGGQILTVTEPRGQGEGTER